MVNAVYDRNEWKKLIHVCSKDSYTYSVTLLRRNELDLNSTLDPFNILIKGKLSSLYIIRRELRRKITMSLKMVKMPGGG